MDNLLEVNQLSKDFALGSILSRVRITAVDHVSFEVKPAEIFALAGESGCGKTTTARIILVTHDMGVQANIADRVGIMYAGKIVEEATTEKVYGQPFHPYTRFLINSLPKFGDKSVRVSVPGSPPSLANLPSGCPFHPRCPQVMDICRKEMPGFTQLGVDHRVACWMTGGDANG